MLPVALNRLRVAATMCHGISGLGMRVSTPSGSPLLAVSRSAVTGIRTLNPCAFRQAVADAVSCHVRGGRVEFCGMPDGAAPVLELVAGEGTTILPGGICRAETDAGIVYAFGTVVDHAVMHDLVALVEEQSGQPTRIAMRFDVLTEVTVALTLARAHPCALDQLDELEALLACVAIEEAETVLRTARQAS